MAQLEYLRGDLDIVALGRPVVGCGASRVGRHVYRQFRYTNSRSQGNLIMNVRDLSPTSRSPRRLRERLGLSRERMARLIDYSAKSVERWEERESEPTSGWMRARLAKIEQIADLGLTVYTPEGFQRFLTTPLPEFSGLTPFHLIEIGQADRVLAALAADHEGLGG